MSWSHLAVGSVVVALVYLATHVGDMERLEVSILAVAQMAMFMPCTLLTGLLGG
ncbi:MAG: hypothetical protein JXQ73_03245 [Phycisphaerae bacterium]|nr:hypothetical protein [Phycisphaerae bacterium]